MDHLERAKQEVEIGAGFMDDGRPDEGERRVSLAAVHAQIAQVEETKRLADQLEAFSGDLSPLCVSVQR
jgi:hypothetical protein